jgi:CubicO group peptidase (beta-lactamase class C family)
VIAAGFEAVADAVEACGPGGRRRRLGRRRLGGRRPQRRAPDQALLHTWSAVKPVTGTCLLHLGVDVEMPVVEVWPEVGDDRLLVRHLLTHTAGRFSVPPDVAMTDWDVSVAAVTPSAPDWPPGAVVCEHAMTFGHLVGEVVRRIDGRSVGRVLARTSDSTTSSSASPTTCSTGAPPTVGLTDGWWDGLRGEPGRCATAPSDRSSTSTDGTGARRRSRR